LRSRINPAESWKILFEHFPIFRRGGISKLRQCNGISSPAPNERSEFWCGVNSHHHFFFATGLEKMKCSLKIWLGTCDLNNQVPRYNNQTMINNQPTNQNTVRFGVAQNRIYHKPEHSSVYGNPEPYLFWFGIILVLGKFQHPNRK
jgi:hypothetical protein